MPRPFGRDGGFWSDPGANLRYERFDVFAQFLVGQKKLFDLPYRVKRCRMIPPPEPSAYLRHGGAGQFFGKICAYLPRLRQHAGAEFRKQFVFRNLVMPAYGLEYE